MYNRSALMGHPVLSVELQGKDVSDIEPDSTSLWRGKASVTTYGVLTGSVSDRYLKEWRIDSRLVDELNN